MRKEVSVLYKSKKQCIDLSKYIDMAAIIAYSGGAEHTYNELLETTKHRYRATLALSQGEWAATFRRKIDGINDRQQCTEDRKCLLCLDDNSKQYHILCCQCLHVYCFECFAIYRQTFKQCALCKIDISRPSFLIVRPEDGPPIMQVKTKIAAIRLWLRHRRSERCLVL